MKIADVALAVRHLGPGWVLGRMGYAVRRRMGALERVTPLKRWDEVPGARVNLQPATAHRPLGQNRAEAIARGEFRLYSARTVQAGFPPAWNRNQATGEVVPSQLHWSRLGDFAFGDIKDVWELSRFAWAYDLVRHGGAEAEGVFWRLLADWMEKNQPNGGPNWMCGQEAAIRLMAVAFAVERFGLPREQAERVGRFVVATGRRIAGNLDYALAQKNNHGISECVGLLTAALLIPGHGEADRWRKTALRELEAQVSELVYADGAFAQHSLVYHRLALHQLCWAALRLRGAGLPEPEWLSAAGRRATDFLAALTDAETGDAPLYGANDGANIMPLTDCAFTDMRPAVQLGRAVFQHALTYAPGPWDEAAFWLVKGAVNLPRAGGECPLRWHAPEGGLLLLRRGQDRLALRCPQHFRHRPGQADLGHVDIWLAGQRVAIDGGSFAYNSKERFTSLGTAREHNAVTVDGREPMRKVTRFLYVPWPEGSVRLLGTEGGEYAPRIQSIIGARWRRAVAVRSAGGFSVTDTIEGAGDREIRWHWRLIDAAWEMNGTGMSAELGGRVFTVRWELPANSGIRVVRADAQTASGWGSPHYGEVKPALSLVICARASDKAEARFEFLHG